jgi:hypothetical protein
VLWTELYDLNPARVEVELAKRGLRIDHLVTDAEDDPGAATIVERLSTLDAKRRFALEWFGDQEHPQPKERKRRVAWTADNQVVYYDPTPEWGRLSPLDENGHVVEQQEELDLGGEGYTDDELAVVIRLLREGRLKARRLESESGMSWRRSYRLWQWFDTGAAGWNETEKKLISRPVLKWVKRKTRSGDRRTLIQSE